MQNHGRQPDDDSGVPGPPARLENTRGELAAAVVACISDRSAREEIRSVMRPLCVRAREDRMDAAELVKVVKQSFANAGAASLDGATERQQMLDRIISVCIDEYYAV